MVCIDNIHNTTKDRDFHRFIVLGHGLFKSSLTAAKLFELEPIIQAKAQYRDGMLQKNTQHVGQLELALKGMLSTSEIRIQLRNGDFKGLSFLSMIIAQAGAIEHGHLPEWRIVPKGAKPSVEFCLHAVQNFLDNAQIPYVDEVDPSPLAGGTVRDEAEDRWEFDFLRLSDVDFLSGT
ncbi:hypothetical protein QQS21_005497 [Conoideocrella luteorostrata]|uniref:Uncharacterized protein n=1 Tax=Conoideocrella luteorostrata TaxID=1105319 RepID=A0AAJ0FYY8_9HYPO|nr:hypothetical protein QQS21_005497 [Conoideocrella luteorostrata]